MAKGKKRPKNVFFPSYLRKILYMPSEQMIPLRITILLVGHFQNALTESEREELDRWIVANDENMIAFEQCLEMALLAPRFFSKWS